MISYKYDIICSFQQLIISYGILYISQGTKVSDGLRRTGRAPAACRRAGVDLLDVPTEGSVADPLVRFFRMREVRGARR
jgi:hypothetical protein